MRRHKKARDDVFVRKLSAKLQKYVDALTLELSHMSEADRTRHGERREHLAEELA